MGDTSGHTHQGRASEQDDGGALVMDREGNRDAARDKTTALGWIACGREERTDSGTMIARSPT